MDKQSDIRFDNYIDNYKHKIQNSIGFIGQNVDFFIEIKARILLEIAGKHLSSTKTVGALDIGSGIGLVDKIIATFFKTLTGVDVEEGVIEKAKLNNPGVNYLVYDGKRLPFEDESFHFVFAVNVIHHVPPVQWQTFLTEMHRILKQGGLAAVFEHNPSNFLTRKAVRHCEFDKDAVLVSHKKLIELFEKSGLKIVDDAYIIFFPIKGSLFRKIEQLLKWLPLGAQHYIAGIKP